MRETASTYGPERIRLRGRSLHYTPRNSKSGKAKNVVELRSARINPYRTFEGNWEGAVKGASVEGEGSCQGLLELNDAETDHAQRRQTPILKG